MTLRVDTSKMKNPLQQNVFPNVPKSESIAPISKVRNVLSKHYLNSMQLAVQLKAYNAYILNCHIIFSCTIHAA